MPSTADNTAGSSQLNQTIARFTALTDPRAISDALLVFDHALQGEGSQEITQRILDTIPITFLLQLLQADYGDETEYIVERTCNVFESLLRGTPYSALIQDPVLSGALLQALNSSLPRVHALGLSQVDKVADEDPVVLRQMLESDVFKAAIAGITSDSISIAERTKQTLLKICGTEEHLTAVINFGGSLSLIQDLTQSKNSIAQLRMTEVLTAWAGQSHGSLSVLKKAGLFESLKDDLNSADVLTRFNIIEILSEFGTTASGSDFLDHSGILTRLAAVVQDEADQDSLGIHAIVKLYGKLGASEHVDFVSLDMKYQILAQLERLLVGDDDFEPDESLKVEAMASIGLVGGNIQNVEWVSQSHCADTFIGRLPQLSRDSKVAWHHSLAQILACSPDPSPETDRIISAFYGKLEGPGQSPFIARLLVSAKSQSVELAMSALAVMIPLARYPFGKMGSQREVITFLLERNAEHTHAQKVAKHEVVEALLKTFQTTKDTSNIQLLTTDQVSLLDLVRRQGPFYQRATATVAIQDMAA
ncbi:26S proteasome non-ATPase regulatory subunit 5 [Mortierella sp. GBA43]|nr:26S proteasome non-ATPase regulatory subunit 5 [Mortierella sp. GBA43]